MKPLSFTEIETVMLDMDGTMLDKHFDDYFWEHLVPERYAERHHVPIERAKAELMSLYKAHEGTLNWTDIDFWSTELDLDIPALKEQITHLIAVHPNVEDFLNIVKERNKRLLLVTNAHYKVLDIKLRETQIGRYFDRCITSFEIGYPKENMLFWQRLQEAMPFDRQKTVFIDDTCEVLHTARQFGIRHLVLKQRASTKRADKPCPDFHAISDFKELLGLF